MAVIMDLLHYKKLYGNDLLTKFSKEQTGKAVPVEQCKIYDSRVAGHIT